MLNENTRLVAFPHVSNLLGAVVDVEEVTKLVHEHGAKVVVDGVAYAPHRAIDVRKWDVDWYVYSTYKVFWPSHGGSLWEEQGARRTGGAQPLFYPERRSLKFELGGANHEGCAGLLALGDYLQTVAEAKGPVSHDNRSRLACHGVVRTHST